MIVRCTICKREVGTFLAPDHGAITMSRHGDSFYPCAGSGTLEWVPIPTRASRLPGVGKRATAPCGHDGEHVTPNMVACSLGCPDPRKPARMNHYQCRHPVKMTWNGTTSCKDCGKVFVRGP